MIQCFAEDTYASCLKMMPKLISASKIDAYYTEHPRLLHSHKKTVEFLFVRSGTGVYIVDEQRYDIKKGDLIICNAGVLHDEDPHSSQDLNTYSVAITNVKIKGLPDDCLIPPDACPVISTDEHREIIENLMRTIYFMLASDAPDVGESCHFLTASLVTITHRIFAERLSDDMDTSRSTSDVLTARIKQYIDLHYDQDLTLQSIGDKLHVSTYYLSHVFKEKTGYAPMQYIMRRRVGEAQTLLISTKYPITQIAGLVGYDSPSHFNATFSKFVGMSPTQYRKSYTKP